MDKKSLYERYIASDISFFSVEIVLAAAFILGGPFWAWDIFREGFWAQGLGLLLNSIVGGGFLIIVSLKKKAPLFYVILIAMILIAMACVNSLPEQVRNHLNWS